MESIEKIKLEEGKIYFFMIYALVCGGKSTFFEQILSQTGTEENKNKYNVKLVSSDEIRSNLSHEMQKKNPHMTFQQCFDKLGKATAQEYDKQIKKAIDSKEENKINIILADKNYPNGIDKFLQLFCKDLSTQFFILFTPNPKKTINFKGCWFPFSIDYVIQCYLRLKNRHGHETLNGEDENSKLVFISFLKLFQGFNFKMKTFKDPYYASNIFFHSLDFVDESKEVEIDNEIQNFFDNVMKKIKAFDMEKIKNEHQSEIDRFFKYIDEKYDGKNFFEDTREKMKNQISDMLLNGITIEKGS